MLVGLGVVAFVLAGALGIPPSRDLVVKLGTLVDMARRADPERFRAQLEPLNPFVNGKFVHKKITGMLRADLSAFGELCQRLQRDARALDRRAHLGLLPIALYLVGIGAWSVLAP